jgi:hypothetical protein
MTRHICLLFGTALLAMNLSAQVTSEILGTVRDASDALLPDAQVTVKQLESECRPRDGSGAKLPSVG